MPRVLLKVTSVSHDAAVCMHIIFKHYVYGYTRVELTIIMLKTVS
jgi:hypothetical protein